MCFEKLIISLFLKINFELIKLYCDILKLVVMLCNQKKLMSWF